MDADATLVLDLHNIVNQRVASGLLTRRSHSESCRGGSRIGATRATDVRHRVDGLQMRHGRTTRRSPSARANATGAHVRIVAMTHAMNADRDRCLAAGMDGYLSKPIRGCCLPWSRSDAGHAPARDRTAAEPPLMRAHCCGGSGDTMLMTDVIRVFLNDLPVRLSAIHDAVTGRNAAALFAAAHALKGAAGNLSATGLFEAAQVLERIGAESRMDAAEAAWRRLAVEGTNVMDALRSRPMAAEN